jgi:hypothetical protein
MKRLAFSSFALLCLASRAWAYPPQVAPGDYLPMDPGAPGAGGLLFHTSHDYVSPWGEVIIDVDVYNNYFGDFSKYWWVYTVHNVSYEPEPPNSNGFSGFETTLPVAVADIGDVSAPDGIPPWLIDCCSGLPVEWDLTNTGGAAVGGGTLPGETEVYAFTTAPRLVTQSTGWFHTWTFDFQAYIFNYPEGDGIEVPDVLNDPGQELCCYQDPSGTYICEILPAGECDFIGGTVVIDCDHCPPPTPTKDATWGAVKGLFRE